MELKKLKELLNRTGNAFFTKYYNMLSNDDISSKEVLDYVLKDCNYTKGSCRVRISCARRIIKEGYGKAALNLIISSKRTTKKIQYFAKVRLENLEEKERNP